MTMDVKKSRKIPMEYIADKEKRVVSFSKRRSGLFKKSDHLHRLTGADATVHRYLTHFAVDAQTLSAAPDLETEDLTSFGAALEVYLTDHTQQQQPDRQTLDGGDVMSRIEGINQTLTECGHDLGLQQLVALRSQAEEMRDTLIAMIR